VTPDSALVIFTSLGSASVFLALLIGMGDGRQELIVSLSNMTPSARREARMVLLDEMTQIADDAIEARRLGKRRIAGQIGF
jgi:hypothetical protein